MKLREHIKSLQRERGLTQECPPAKLQVSQQAVDRWEAGSALPSIGKARRAREGLFNLPPERLSGTAAPSGSREERQRRLTQRRKPPFFLAPAAFLLLFFWFLWQSGQGAGLPSGSAASLLGAYERLENHLLSETLSGLPDGRSVWLRLVLGEGEHFTDAYEDYLPGGGSYPVNYRGSYWLEVWDAGENCLSAYALNGDFDGEAMNFPGEVALSLFDYNGDGLPELTLGQYGSSSANLYQLYTLREDGNIVKSCPEPVADSSDITHFSIVFPQEEGKGFSARCWNNALGEMEETAYLWNEEAGQFLPAR